MKKRITINRHIIKANKDKGEQRPPISVQRSGQGVVTGQQVLIYGKDGALAATIIYDPQHPLKCGATVWIESDNAVSVINGVEIYDT